MVIESTLNTRKVLSSILSGSIGFFAFFFGGGGDGMFTFFTQIAFMSLPYVICNLHKIYQQIAIVLSRQPITFNYNIFYIL